MVPGGAADLSGEYAGGRKPSKLEELQRTMAGNNTASPQQQQQQQKAAGSVQSQVIFGFELNFSSSRLTNVQNPPFFAHRGR
jgi:hypothetical protein